MNYYKMIEKVNTNMFVGFIVKDADIFGHWLKVGSFGAQFEDIIALVGIHLHQKKLQSEIRESRS